MYSTNISADLGALLLVLQGHWLLVDPIANEKFKCCRSKIKMHNICNLRYSLTTKHAHNCFGILLISN